MQSKEKKLQQRYLGFLKTPSLWKNTSVFNLKQVTLDTNISTVSIVADEKQRLGKYIEQFVLYNLKEQKNTIVLAKNLQIFNNKTTIGELDCIYKKNNVFFHLEIVYKFYLYLPDKNKEELHCFIGPNKKDSLIEKLEKLKLKQLPLLYSSSTNSYLKNLKLSANTIKQEVCFKAQLFLPLKFKNITLKKVNNNAIFGFYMNSNELYKFKECKFYIPIKKDWLLIPKQHVNWMSITDFKIKTKQLLLNKFSPLCWLKNKNGEIEKFFLVWWS